MAEKGFMGIDMEREGEIVGDLGWDGLHRPRIYYAMVATFSGLFLAVLDGTICNVALPSISRICKCLRPIPFGLSMPFN